VSFLGRIKEVFLFLSKTKSYLSEGRGLISLIVGVGRKEKLKFSDGRSGKQHLVKESSLECNVKEFGKILQGFSL